MTVTRTIVGFELDCATAYQRIENPYFWAWGKFGNRWFNIGRQPGNKPCTVDCGRSSRRGGHFPSDDAASKLIWLALRNITPDWSQVNRDWKEVMNQFAVLYEDRFANKVY